ADELLLAAVVAVRLPANHNQRAGAGVCLARSSDGHPFLPGHGSGTIPDIPGGESVGRALPARFPGSGECVVDAWHGESDRDDAAGGLPRASDRAVSDGEERSAAPLARIPGAAVGLRE